MGPGFKKVSSAQVGHHLPLCFLPSAVPNRSTFTCPYCGARNLDQQELVKHCVDNHRSDPNRVVSACCQPAWVPEPHYPPMVPSWDPGVGASPLWLSFTSVPLL